MVKNHSLIIILCFGCLILSLGCDKADIQKSLPKDDPKLTSRTDDCEDCPVNDCCCAVVLTGGVTPPATVTLCGTDGPRLSTTECGPIEAGACTIMGYTLDRTLTSGSPRGFFCMAPNTAFCLQGPVNAQLSITCQVGQTSPQTVNVTLGASKVYYTVNGDCELVSCL